MPPEPLWKRYEVMALEAMEQSDKFLVPGNSSQWVAQVYAQQAQVYATLALVHRNQSE
jgi:hypothetical protein